MDPKAVARRYFERLPRDRDLAVCDELLAPDYLDHDAPPGTPRGPVPVKAFVGSLLAHHPDLSIAVEDIFGEGDRVALRPRWDAHDTGYHQAGIVILRFDTSGRIAERWSAYMPA